MSVLPQHTHIHHDGDGLRLAGCGGPRARYIVHGLTPEADGRLVLSRLGFKRGEVRQIMAEAMRAFALRWCAPARWSRPEKNFESDGPTPKAAPHPGTHTELTQRTGPRRA